MAHHDLFNLAGDISSLLVEIDKLASPVRNDDTSSISPGDRYGLFSQCGEDLVGPGGVPARTVFL